LQHSDKSGSISEILINDWKAVEEQTIEAIGLRHRSYSTEKTYIAWLRQFKVFINSKNLKELNGKELLKDGYDIRTIKELLGHRNLQTTMIYTHVATKNVLGVRSPLDK
jgi:site-specific recombinase XerD